MICFQFCTKLNSMCLSTVTFGSITLPAVSSVSVCQVHCTLRNQVAFAPSSAYFTLACYKITHDRVYCVVMWNYWLIPGSIWSKTWVWSGLLAEITGLNANGGKSVCRECCVLSGRGFCIGLMTHQKEIYCVWCV